LTLNFFSGTETSRDCTLIVTEGDSAAAFAVSGLSVVGHEKFGIFPLKGRLLNVRDPKNHDKVSLFKPFK
jgi:DNA topoisomerase-2